MLQHLPHTPKSLRIALAVIYRAEEIGMDEAVREAALFFGVEQRAILAAIDTWKFRLNPNEIAADAEAMAAHAADPEPKRLNPKSDPGFTSLESLL